MSLGAWDGLRPADVPELGAVLTSPDRRPPGGESLSDLLGRARRALDRCVPDDRNAIVVAHRLVNAVIVADGLGLGVAAAGFVQQDPGGIDVLWRDADGLRVLMVNVTPDDPLGTLTRTVTLV
jgi:broad specificity phosphatase PhoE